MMRDNYGELFSFGDRFIAATKYNYDYLIKFGLDENKIIFHPLGIDINRFTKKHELMKTDEKIIRIITVARLVEEKGLCFAISLAQNK